ncbi:hypothetical protein HYPSUDRAFT_49373 [Hypholoma sublateritium FD-334 SS-4]|uniref:Uncharacterized protein n=1 Tax=Hypholoma sublateritium (strain FD-334 SS-4) TaxID=945553 RepID=A0A0D2NAI0_HYPSF|nr:hypothetical protein HYPSUDRAFT_49766 [Hypholoma sublateritium FD-334 SS-4]KJA14211.1 hypothetical protein HYPSUDRAFT_49373 [Hypholoma sublateritium FD-334 SS-4]
MTYTSFAGYDTEITAFVIVEDCPVDVILPADWFPKHSLEPVWQPFVRYFALC